MLQISVNDVLWCVTRRINFGHTGHLKVHCMYTDKLTVMYFMLQILGSRLQT